MRLLFLFLLVSCATEVKKTESPVKAPVQVNQDGLRDKCENEAHAISCARYGYLTKDITYTRYACRLGDQNSCFNAQEIENRAPNQNFAIISAHQGQIYGCYVNNSIDENNGDGLKKEKEIELIFQIDTRGELTSLSVIGQTLSQKFKDCVISSFTAKKFIAVDFIQSIRYSFAMPEVATDKRMKGRKQSDYQVK